MRCTRARILGAIRFELRYFRRGRPPLMGRQLIDEPIRKFRSNAIDASLKLVS
jgi:hypothetical protein